MAADLGGGSVADLLGGWDTAYVTTIGRVNAEIVKQKASPPNMHFVEDDQTVTADFDPWSLAIDSAATGSNIVVAIPVRNAKITYASTTPGDDDDTFTFPDGHVFHADLELEMYVDGSDTKADQAAMAKSANGTKIAIAPPRRVATGNSWLVARYLGHTKDSEGDMAHMAEDAFADALTAWLTKNVKIFDAIFAKAIPGLGEAQAEFGHFMPNGYAYAVACPTLNPTPKNSLFAILGVQDLSGLAALQPQIAADALPAGAEAAYILSPQVFMSTVMKPAVQAMFLPNTTPKLGLVQGTGQLTNMSALVMEDIDLSKVKGGKLAVTGKSPTIDVNQLVASIEYNELKVDITNLHFTTESGMENITLNLTYWFKLSLGDDGTFKVAKSRDTVGSARINLTQKEADYEAWSMFALTMMQIMMSLVPGGGEAEAATTTTTTAAGETAEIATSTVTSESESLSLTAQKMTTEEAINAIAGTGKPLTTIANRVLLWGTQLAEALGTGAMFFVVPKFFALQRHFQQKANHGHGPDVAATMDDVMKHVLNAAHFGVTPSASAPRCTAIELNNGVVFSLSFK